MTSSTKKYVLRVLRDFPWLWAVRDCWYPGGDVRHVRIEKKRQAVASALLQKITQAGELWRRVSSGDLVRVEQATWREGASLRQCLNDGFPTGYRLDHFVVIQEVHQGEAITVYTFGGRNNNLHELALCTS